MNEAKVEILKSVDFLNYSLGLENGNYSKIEEDSDGYIPHEERLERYVIIIFILIFIFGTVWNGSVIFIFLRHSNMRNIPNTYIFSLAVGDQAVILFCVPFISTVYTNPNWPFGENICKFSEFVKDLSIGVSVFTLTVLSINRYIAICKCPMRRKITITEHGFSVHYIVIFFIWIFATLFALPSAIFSHLEQFPISEDGKGEFIQVCYPYPIEFGKIFMQFMVLFKFIVYYALPLLIISTLYIIMAWHLVKSTKTLSGNNFGMGGTLQQRATQNQIKTRKKAAVFILSISIIFAICFLPSHIFFLWFYFYPNAEDEFNDYWNALRIIGFILTFLNSSINPVTLYCFSGIYRKYFNQHLFSLCKTAQPADNSINSIVLQVRKGKKRESKKKNKKVAFLLTSSFTKESKDTHTTVNNNSNTNKRNQKILQQHHYRCENEIECEEEVEEEVKDCKSGKIRGGGNSICSSLVKCDEDEAKISSFSSSKRSKCKNSIVEWRKRNLSSGNCTSSTRVEIEDDLTQFESCTNNFKTWQYNGSSNERSAASSSSKCKSWSHKENIKSDESETCKKIEKIDPAAAQFYSGGWSSDFEEEEEEENCIIDKFTNEEMEYIPLKKIISK